MKETCDCNCNICDIDFSKDNGYGFVLQELKATRAHIDEIIKIIELRMEKDNLINEVLNTDYEDEDKKEIVTKRDETPLDAILQAIAIRNILDFPYNNTTRLRYPNHLWRQNAWY